MHLIHALFEPPGDGPHPTILALHGRGANALDLLGLAPYLCGGGEYEMGHEISGRSLMDLSAWLEEKVLSSVITKG